MCLIFNNHRIFWELMMFNSGLNQRGAVIAIMRLIIFCPGMFPVNIYSEKM